MSTLLEVRAALEPEAYRLGREGLPLRSIFAESGPTAPSESLHAETLADFSHITDELLIVAQSRGAGARQVDSHNVSDFAPARRHHHYAIPQKDGFGNAVRDKKHGLL